MFIYVYEELRSVVFDMVQNGMSIQISQDYSSMVNFARCKCLGANVLRGPDQIPWDGKLNYDYQLWIDSDIVFDTNKFWQLCDVTLPHRQLMKKVMRLKEADHPISNWLVFHRGWKNHLSCTLVGRR